MNIPKKCKCGSGEIRYPLYDARSIFCTYVCVTCEDEARKEFRAEIFTNPNYSHSEPIDEENWG